MIRLSYWIIASLLITALIAWLISLPGTLTIELLGYRLQPQLGVAAFFLIAAIGVVILVWGIAKRIVAAPYYLARRSRERRKDAGYLALSDGFIALQSGDAARARQLAREAQTHLPRHPAAQLLEARADLAVGDMHSAREHYRALISNRKTAVAALAGLFDQARQQGRPDVALTFAQKALDIVPMTPWAREAVFEDLTRNGRWDEALTMIADDPAITREERMRRRRRQAVVETARAQIDEGREPMAALEHALSALKLQADFVPAALIAARIYINRNEARRAQSLLRRVWRATSHPDVALLFANAVPGASAVDRLKRMRYLLGVTTSPDDAYLTMRGIRTLALRMAEHSRRSQALAAWLEQQPEVLQVYHPALPSHPDHALWSRDFTGAGSLFAFRLKARSRAALAAMVDGFELFGMGYSWGGYESLCLPIAPASARTAVAWTAEGQMFRVHVGLEDFEDLKADLAAALARYAATTA